MKIKKVLFFLFISSNVFSQSRNKILSDSKKVVQCVIETDLDFRNLDYLVCSKLKKESYTEFNTEIKKYKLKRKVSFVELGKQDISLQIIKENEFNKYVVLADSLNKIYTTEFERLSPFTLIYNQTHKECCNFSIPLFSKNGKFAIIKFEANTGYGYYSKVYLMSKLKNRWVLDSILRIAED